QTITDKRFFLVGAPSGAFWLSQCCKQPTFFENKSGNAEISLRAPITRATATFGGRWLIVGRAYCKLVSPVAPTLKSGKIKGSGFIICDLQTGGALLKSRFSASCQDFVPRADLTGSLQILRLS